MFLNTNQLKDNRNPLSTMEYIEQVLLPEIAIMYMTQII